MGIAYRSDHALGLTVMVWDGLVTVEDWRVHFAQMTDDPSWPSGRLGLLDATNADTSALSHDDFRRLAAAFRGHGPKIAGIKYAIVAGELAYRYALTFQEASGPTGLVMVVFSDLDVACEWLDIGVEDVEPALTALRVDIRNR